MSNPLYRVRRRLHCLSGFFIRNVGEIGVVLFILLIVLLLGFLIAGNFKFEYILSFVAAFGVYAAFVVQQRAKMQEVVGRLDDQFYEDLLPTRRRFGKALLDHKSPRWSAENDEIDDVLDFFESVGFFVRSGALSFFLADEAYSYWMLRYHKICEGRIIDCRKRDSYAYEAFDWFTSKIPPKGDIGEDALMKFVKEEATYGLETSAAHSNSAEH